MVCRGECPTATVMIRPCRCGVLALQAAEGSDLTRSYLEARLGQKLGLARFRAAVRDVLARSTLADVDEAADCVRAHYLSHLL